MPRPWRLKGYRRVRRVGPRLGHILRLIRWCAAHSLRLEGVPGIICNGAFFTLGMLPDFNKPCRK